jgi:DNA (cytosine-5)-methyltransferase 1
MKIIDIFCGVGGFSKGFLDYGAKVAYGIDNWDIALETFKINHKSTKIIKKDVRDIPNSFFLKLRKQIDVIISGPPCQGFSMSGKRNPKDLRNTLFEEVIRATDLIKPKITVMENVVGLKSMKTHNGYPVIDLIKDRFNEIGYKVDCRVLNAADYGVPQLRKRIFFVASKNLRFIVFPDATHFEKKQPGKKGKWITVGEALKDINSSRRYLSPRNEYQKKMRTSIKKIFNHEIINHSKEIIERMSKVPRGGNWQNIPKKYYNVGGEHSNNYRRLDPSKPSITLKHASKSMIIHPFKNRGITVREVARLQSFDNSFIFKGVKYDQHQQLANAVPPLFGYAFAKKFKKILK